MSQSPDRNRGHRNGESERADLKAKRHKAQPETEGIETHSDVVSVATGRVWSQSPARNRGHRNLGAGLGSGGLLAGHKAQPETEGIETVHFVRCAPRVLSQSSARNR